MVQSRARLCVERLGMLVLCSLGFRLLPAPSALYASGRMRREASFSSVFRVLTQADSWVEKEEPAPSN